MSRIPISGVIFKIMPAKHVIDIKSKLIITTWEGDATDIDFIKGLKEYQKNILSKSEYYGFNEILDLTRVTAIKLTTAGLKMIGSVASTTDSKEISTKLAFIVSSNLAYGLARMYGALRAYSNNSTKTIRAFKKESDAYEWVQK